MRSVWVMGVLAAAMLSMPQASAQTETTLADEREAVSPAAERTWDYTSVEDRMTGAVVRRAFIRPVDALGEDGALLILERNADDIIRIIVSPGNQDPLNCSYSRSGPASCIVRIRFDGGQVRSYFGGPSRSMDGIIISDSMYTIPLLRRLREAKHVMVQVEYRYRDSDVFEFATEGLRF